MHETANEQICVLCYSSRGNKILQSVIFTSQHAAIATPRRLFRISTESRDKFLDIVLLVEC